MATRSTIAVELANGNIKQVYCHYDGYLQYVGNVLANHYTTVASVEKLVDKGAISSLGMKIGRKHSFDKRSDEVCTFYARDRGEPLQVATYKNIDYYNAHSTREDYNYLFRGGSWLVRKHDAVEFEPLTAALARVI